MNKQEVRDRIKMVFTLLSEGQSQCVSRALKADAMLEKNLPGLAAASLKYVKRDLMAQETRIRFAYNELEVLREALK